MADDRPSLTFRIGLAAACCIAFSPVIVELIRSLGRVDGRWVILLAPLLTVLAVVGQTEAGVIHRRRGVMLIVAGLALELVGITLTSSTMARIGLPVAGLGVGQLLGQPGSRQLALLFFMVPIPISVTSVTTPWLESLYADICVRVLHGGLGLGLQASGPLLLGSGATLELFASDSGIWLAYVFAGLGWYAGLLARRSFPALLGGAALWSLLGWPLQVVATLVAASLLIAGAPHAARSWLGWGVHLAVSAAVLLALYSHRRRTQAARNTSP